MPEVSVIIPSYNSADTLPRAIGSVLAQTISDFEVVVVDDASEDDTEVVVEAYDDDRISFVKHEQNKGGSAARNTGLEHTSGRYVAYLDADDEWHPQKLEKQLAELESRSDDWVAVHCDRAYDMSLRLRVAFALSSIVGAKKKNPPKEGGEELIKEILLLNLSTGASTLLVERDTVEKIGGFDPVFPRHQDWEFLIRVLQQGKLAYVDEQLVLKHGTGRPGIETYEEGKELLLSKFSDEIEQLERRGYDVTRVQQLQLTKLYIAEGQLREGAHRLDLFELGPREIASVLWYVPEGVHNIATRFYLKRLWNQNDIRNTWRNLEK